RGGRGRLVWFGLGFGDRRFLSFVRHRNARKLLYFNSLVGIGHDVVPGHRRQRAAGHAVGHLVIVIAEPDAADEIARIAHEPRITVSVGRARLAGGRNSIQPCAFAGAVFDHTVHHLDHVRGDTRRHHLPRLRTVTV